MWDTLCRIDDAVIRTVRTYRMPLSRAALFIVYFWFGVLKVVGESPATPMVVELQTKTLPFIPTGTFIVLFGLFEVLIGIAFLIPRIERYALVVMVAHMGMTMLPLILVPHAVWTGFLVPTLEGQYIIKNVALLAVAAGIAAQLIPLRHEHS